ncbi:MAG: AraC-like DNA-binding protein [Alteromonadaceae bacterium]|jgi:AraC-like DNA-binding protein
MPNYNRVTASEESTKVLVQPIVVVNRQLSMNSWVEKHRHNWGQFVYANSGVMAVITDGGRYLIPPEQGVWVPATIDHEIITSTDVELTSLYIENEQTEGFPFVCQVLSVSPFLKVLLNEAKTIKHDYQWQSTAGRLLRLIRDNIKTASPIDLQLPYPKDKRLKEIVSRLQKFPALKTDLNSWGKFVGASVRTLSRTFKKETGITYSEWKQRLNIQIAIKQLYMGESVGNIAINLGYESSSAFIYMFKKQMKVTPSNYLSRDH